MDFPEDVSDFEVVSELCMIVLSGSLRLLYEILDDWKSP
jgi:hypothetical protein